MCEVDYISIIIAGFQGNDNSSKRLLDYLRFDNIFKIYLENNKEKCVKQVLDVIKDGDIMIAFGQKPVLKDKISIELAGKSKDSATTTRYPYNDILSFCRGRYQTKVSTNAGTSYCNHLYYSIMEYCEVHKIDLQMIFIHIPLLNHISDFQYLANSIQEYIHSLIIKRM